MARTLTRRSALVAFSGALAYTALPRAASSQAEPPENVWAGMLGPIADHLGDLPPRVYVPHETGGDIAVIDPLTRTIVDRFAIGRIPHHVTPSWDMASLY